MDNIEREKKELDLLIESGVSFKVPKRSFLKHFGNKERTFEINQLYLGTLDYLSAEYINIDFSEGALSGGEKVFNEAKRLQSVNSKRCAKIVAIAVLNSRFKIKYFSGIMTNYFLWHITPEKLNKIANIIISISNLSDFISSIRLLSINQTTTAPKLIDMASPQV
jgi:hypothetical protein